ncbi:MAG: hypothetical protein HQ567_08055 [Candidatus Nealsonbacteria bacterium]|nr:hypothetical protein [Candidatus Nealsonbacteria bacterium]
MACKNTLLRFLMIPIGLTFLLGDSPSFGQGREETATDAAQRWPEFAHKHFQFQPARGIGRERDVTRRDVSDVIQVGDVYYIWYSKVDHGKLGPELRRLKHTGYVATIWYAVSNDEGHSWEEKGQGIRWGICMKDPGGPWPYLIRYEVDLKIPTEPVDR